MKDMYKKTLDEYCEKINHALLRLTENKPELQKIVCEAMEYSLSAGGKRIRPVLMLEFCKMCGGNSEKYIDLSCTVEMVHTYSLIHDDLPCMDNDDFRRGKPSCHKMFPEAIALLAGDALNTLPYEIISSKAIEGTISYESSVKLSNILSSSTGVMGMIGGQVVDIEAEHRKITIDDLNYLQILKTGALIKAACKMGCILGQKPEKIPFAEKYADALGRAFQIVDDILDVTGSFEELGKPIGSDSKQDKSTYISLMGLEKSKDEAEKLTNEAISILDNFENSDFLKELTMELLTRKK